MQGDSIAEVRGIAKNQNMDSRISETDILDTKLSEFGDEKKRFQKKNHHMKRLTRIESLNKTDQEITEEDLRFLYELDELIVGFGHSADPRIKEIISTRNEMNDLVRALDCDRSQISKSLDEALSGKTIYHLGDLDLSKVDNLARYSVPKYIRGDLFAGKRKTLRGFERLERVGGTASFDRLEYASEIIDGEVVEGLKSLRFIGYVAYFPDLKSAKGLEGLRTILRGSNFSSLGNADGLENLETSRGIFIAKFNDEEKRRIKYFRDK